ncbi:MAG: M42 family metallopeptidase [Candidatus Nanohaloarchaea archaeon]
MKQLLKELVETSGVSGNESKIRQKIMEEIEDEADSVRVDDFGNLIAEKGSNGKNLMLMAHMDQIGLSVKRIDENGFVWFTKIGGMFESGVVNQRVEIETGEGNITGVISIKPPHLQDKEEKNKLPEMDKMFIDIGAEDEEEAREMGVKIGDFIHYQRDFTELGGDRVTAPAFDDRVGCAVAIEAFKRFDEDYKLTVVFSTREEVGTKGAKTATYSVDPDVGLAIDIGMAKVPGIEENEVSSELGDGPGIDLVQASGRGLITPQNVKEWLIDAAEGGEYDYHRVIIEGGATDAMSIELEKDGVPTGSISVPTRHIHSPIEVVKMSDLEDTVEFIEDGFETLEEHF